MLQKKGSILDIAFLLVFALGFAIFILIAGYIFPQITNEIKTNSPIGDNNNSVQALNATDNITLRFDTIFLMIFAGLSIAIFITSFFIDSSPILIPVYIIALGLLMIFAVVAENIYEDFSQVSTFSSIAALHPITNYIMSNLVMSAIAVGVLSMVLIFAKPKGYSGGSY
jgi:hypothetical protein